MTAKPDLLTGTPNADLLSDVLRQVHLAGGVFIRGEFTAPWAYLSTDKQKLTAAIRPTAEYLMLFHLIVEGEPRLRLATGESAQLAAGDAVVFPHCDVHVMYDGDDSAPVPIETLLPPQPWAEMPTACLRGGGARTRILCGYLECDDLVANPFLQSLPRMVHVPATSESAAQWRLASWTYAMEQCMRGDATFLARLPELVLADCLRQYVERQPAQHRGWLAALNEPVVSRALLLMHAQPAYDWTVSDLASRTAASRTVLGEKFRETLGVSPIRYLANWRLQLAMELLRTTDLGLAALAARVGYESEAAFSRAFKRQAGVSPGAWRERKGTVRR